ncbi:hypothetical protein OUZ56_031297 [Daphnia magna]|uniref:Uncharacterized protein n=1 Tax=Daphnia magna TaxID=35525 RepID=A0ABQ9ZUB8_9CRUS|nr:hypothetical protein OUZ56_031297 [Daphnia magna]
MKRIWDAFNVVCWQGHLHSVVVSDATRSLSFFMKKLSFKYREDSFGSNNKDDMLYINTTVSKDSA